jgi:hypothetical protein
MNRSFDTFYPLLYRGEVLMSNALPWHYVPNYLLITTPPVALALVGIGFAACIRRQSGGERTPLTYAAFLLDVWLLFPVLYAVAKRPNVYDGLRHFLFLMPCLALFAGIGAAAGVRWLAARMRPAVAAAAVGSLLMLAAPEMAYLHPYESTYFNVLAGGLARAGHRYETDYWVSSYREAMEWVNARADEAGRQATVLVAANDYSFPCADAYRGPRVTLCAVFGEDSSRALPPDVDYYIATTRFGLAEQYPDAPVVHTVARHGVPFTVIKGRRRRSATAPPPSP